MNAGRPSCPFPAASRSFTRTCRRWWPRSWRAGSSSISAPTLSCCPSILMSTGLRPISRSPFIWPAICAGTPSLFVREAASTMPPRRSSHHRAPRQDVFLGRSASKPLFREIFKRGRGARARWSFNHSALFLDFLAGNQAYQCTPWSNPTYNIFGWQRPGYLLSDEGYAPSYPSLIEDKDWDKYGVGRNPRCDNCMAHCGFEGTAVNDAFAHPLKALKTALRGPRITGPMAPDLPVVHGGRPRHAAVTIPVAEVKRASAR